MRQEAARIYNQDDELPSQLVAASRVWRRLTKPGVGDWQIRRKQYFRQRRLIFTHENAD